MDGQNPRPPWNPHRFTWRELSGGLGDLGVFLPLALGMAAIAGMDLAWILIWAGLANVAGGMLFRQPIPVQPMKAIAAVALAENLAAGEIVAAGMMTGVILVLLAATRTVGIIGERIPRAIVNGIQLGVGLKLAIRGLEWIGGLPATGWDSVAVALAVAAALILLLSRGKPAMLIAFVLGFVLLGWRDPGALTSLGLSLPVPQIHWPSAEYWMTGLFKGALPQLPLTLLNSVVALCALSAHYYPGRGVRLDRTALSVGLMNLVAVPLGGMPMCHGSGGLAAQHRFGARTGGSVIMLGIAKIGIGVFFGAGAVTLLAAYPVSILGVMLAFAGVELARAGARKADRRTIVVVWATAAGILATNTAGGFLIGLLAHGAWAWIRKVDAPASWRLARQIDNR